MRNPWIGKVDKEGKWAQHLQEKCQQWECK